MSLNKITLEIDRGAYSYEKSSTAIKVVTEKAGKR